MKQVSFDTQMMTVIDAATRILAARVLSMISLALTFGLFCWAMYLQAQLPCVIAGGFAVLVFLPVLLGERKKENPDG